MNDLNIFFEHRDAIRAMLVAGDMPYRLYETFYAHYASNGDMSYEVAKGRTVDTHDWVFRRVEHDFNRMEKLYGTTEGNC